jgi:spore coat polysaccharide biosynthesis protein SpsF
MKPKTIVIIQARMQSTRLPGKVLLPLGPNNKPVLWWLIARARMAELVDEVIVATTQRNSNQPLIEFCSQNNTLFYAYHGGEDDVIGRVLTAANWIGADIIIDITGDCPLVDPKHIDFLIGKLISCKVDYVSNDIVERSWPDGLDIQVYWTRVLQECKRLFNPKQHCGWNIPTSGFFDFYTWKAPYEMYWPKLGLTLDTPDDYTLLKIIFNKFGNQLDFSVEEVVQFLKSRPDLVEINKLVKRKAPEEG